MTITDQLPTASSTFDAVSTLRTEIIQIERQAMDHLTWIITQRGVPARKAKSAVGLLMTAGWHPGHPSQIPAPSLFHGPRTRRALRAAANDQRIRRMHDRADRIRAELAALTT